MAKNMILIGFMGTGKSTVGKALAERLQRPFIDTDEWISLKEGRSIEDIFRESGETSFRDLETDTLKELLSQPGQVMATGGGIVLRPENRRLMREKGWVVWLTATEEELLRRLAGEPGRPLLSGNMQENLGRLLKVREGLYDFAHLKVETTGRSVEDIVREILSASSLHCSNCRNLKD